jgi:hypothetical protein
MYIVVPAKIHVIENAGFLRLCFGYCRCKQRSALDMFPVLYTDVVHSL